MSQTASIDCGVPQGSILGPLLFLIYIDDVQKICKNVSFRISLFADDTVVYTSSPSESNALQHMQTGIDNFVNWCDKNKLTVNIEKTKYMGFGNVKCFKKMTLYVT